MQNDEPADPKTDQSMWMLNKMADISEREMLYDDNNKYL